MSPKRNKKTSTHNNNKNKKKKNSPTGGTGPRRTKRTPKKRDKFHKEEYVGRRDVEWVIDDCRGLNQPTLNVKTEEDLEWLRLDKVGKHLWIQLRHQFGWYYLKQTDAQPDYRFRSPLVKQGKIPLIEGLTQFTGYVAIARARESFASDTKFLKHLQSETTKLMSGSGKEGEDSESEEEESESEDDSEDYSSDDEEDIAPTGVVFGSKEINNDDDEEEESTDNSARPSKSSQGARKRPPNLGSATSSQSNKKQRATTGTNDEEDDDNHGASEVESGGLEEQNDKISGKDEIENQSDGTAFGGSNGVAAGDTEENTGEAPELVSSGGSSANNNSNSNNNNSNEELAEEENFDNADEQVQPEAVASAVVPPVVAPAPEVPPRPAGRIFIDLLENLEQFFFGAPPRTGDFISRTNHLEAAVGVTPVTHVLLHRLEALEPIQARALAVMNSLGAVSEANPSATTILSNVEEMILGQTRTDGATIMARLAELEMQLGLATDG